MVCAEGKGGKEKEGIEEDRRVGEDEGKESVREDGGRELGFS